MCMQDIAIPSTVPLTEDHEVLKLDRATLCGITNIGCNWMCTSIQDGISHLHMA